MLGKFALPPAGVQPPALWGTEAHVRALFGDTAAAVHTTPRQLAFRYRSAAHFVELFRSWYGPVTKAFAAQMPDKAEALATALANLLGSLNRAGPGLAGGAERAPRNRGHRRLNQPALLAAVQAELQRSRARRCLMRPAVPASSPSRRQRP